jgi:hypothetical protein
MTVFTKEINIFKKPVKILFNCSNSGSGSRSGTEENFSPSILGSLENEVNWSSSPCSPPRQNRRGGSNTTEQSSPSGLEDNRKRFQDINRINARGEVYESVLDRDKAGLRDPYASEDYVVEAEGKLTECYATLRYATLRYATLRYATLRYATLRYATLHYAFS